MVNNFDEISGRTEIGSIKDTKQEQNVWLQSTILLQWTMGAASVKRIQDLKLIAITNFCLSIQPVFEDKLMYDFELGSILSRPSFGLDETVQI